jgi:maltose alpha-D-glucosyltransferase / alpha-amylase
MIDDLWYKNAILYSVGVESFMDANGDGFGDFDGLTRRLDYLAGLGVTALWLGPFQKSPRRDNGYDIEDYYTVDPRFGTFGDFTELMHHARQRGMRVILDLVINHTSDRHPWFQAARSDRRSKYHGYYCWSEKEPPNRHEGVVFPGVQEATWSYDERARAWYHHRFMPFQPDLDITNEEVQEEIRRIVGFWIELGVSGFRVDAVPFIIEEDPQNPQAAKRFEYLRDLHDFLQWRAGDAILLAEANILPEESERYFGREGDRMHMVFNFQVNQHLFLALATGDARPLGVALERTRERPALSQWANFLRNHDELDLGRLTPEQRQATYAALGPEPHMQLYDRGIRRRLAPMLGGDRRRLELANSLLFALPGTPVLRYGDEIGMGDDLSLPDRHSVRTPMQWSSDANGGFSVARETHLPVIAKGPFAYERVNVADQRRDRDSLLNWTERMIRLRKECPELGWGRYTTLDTGSPNVLGLLCEWRHTALVTLHNFASEAREISFALPDGRPLNNLLVNEPPLRAKNGRLTVRLEPHGYRWYRVGPLLDGLERARF